MVDEFYRQYYNCLFLYRHHELQRSFYSKLNLGISIASYVITAASLAGWSILAKYDVMWSVIIFASQLANGFKDRFKFSEKIWVLDLYLKATTPELPVFAKEARLIQRDEMSAAEIGELIDNHEFAWSKFEAEYLLSYGFSLSSFLKKKAHKLVNKELRYKHLGD